jgi:hypothetical protein
MDGKLEPCTVKVVSTVLRGAGDHKEPRLPDRAMHSRMGVTACRAGNASTTPEPPSPGLFGTRAQTEDGRQAQAAPLISTVAGQGPLRPAGPYGGVAQR